MGVIDTTTAAPSRARRGRVVLHSFGLAMLCLLLATAALGWRLTRGPIALPDWGVARIESRIGRDLAPRIVSLGQVALTYDLAAQALRLRVRDARLREGSTDIVTVPEARVSLDGAALLSGALRPRAVVVDGLSLDVARDADGRFSLTFGAGGGALPGSWKEALETFDAALASPAIADLARVEVSGVALRLTDAVTGLERRVEDGTVEWRRDGAGVRLSLTSAVDLGGRAAQVQASLARRAGSDGPGQGAEARVSVRGLSVAGLAEALPGVPALTLVAGEVSADGAMSVSEDGVPGPLEGRVTAVDARLTDRPALRLDRAALGFSWRPGSGRIALTEIAGSADDVSTTAQGQILMEDGLVGPVQVQLRLGPTVLDPEGLFDRRVEFDGGVAEARLEQAPLELRIGQAVLTGPSGTARLSGRIGFVGGGPRGVLRLVVPRMGVPDLLALWPRTLGAGARDWLAEHVLAGEATDATALLRLVPGSPPDVAASFDFTAGTYRFMPFLPAAVATSGAAELDGERFSIRIDAGSVPGVLIEDQDDPEAPTAGRIDVAGTTFTIADTRQRPARGDLALTANGEIGDILALLDNRPFRLLRRIQRDRDLATGTAEVRVSAQIPLRPRLAPADIAFSVEATLRDVRSETIIPDRLLAGDALSLTLGADAVEIAGDMTVADVPFSGSWRQPLPPLSTEAGDPDAAEAPIDPDTTPLSEPGHVTGVAQVDGPGLARLGISVDAIDLRGTTAVALDVELGRGLPPRIAARSDLRGMSVALPVISWTKARDRAVLFEVDATLGAVPEVTRMAIEAPGLTASGRVSLRSGGGLDRARFDRVDTGWFRGPLVLSGRGSGVSPAVDVSRGTADLRGALAQIDGGEGGGNPAPITLALDRLAVTDGIALTDMRATLRGGSGRFSARLNGGASVDGVLGPDGSGTAVQVTAANAGAALRSAGLFDDAVDGRMTFTLRPTGTSGVFSGAVRMTDLRVRNAPTLASLLQALSVVGILEQLTGEGLYFATVESDFTLRPNDIRVARASAVGPSMSITADGAYDLNSKRLDMQGVISPIYLVNGLFGALFARRDEGLFGFTYRLTGAAADPDVSVNPLSILTPGIFRDIFRSAPPS